MRSNKPAPREGGELIMPRLINKSGTGRTKRR
jgi:hypothetical protein